MNILIPDSWLREYVETKATPKQMKEYLSLCGPSVERARKEKGEVVYDIEITTNRPDAMSVVGVAREAAAILPRFGIPAKLVNDPYDKNFKFQISNFKLTKKLTVKTDPLLNPRWTSIVVENVSIKPSPAWLVRKLEAAGIRPINTVVDITNFLMRAYGQPVHAFDYDTIGKHTMRLRAAKKGEQITTLDGKTHALPGGDIVIEDGNGNLIDLCGIMGAQSSAITTATKAVVLFVQTYDPVRIRRTMMALSHRTEAGSLFEKGTDPELVMPVCAKGVTLLTQLCGGSVASRLYDIYPKPYKPYTVSVARATVDAYIGKHLDEKEIVGILAPLGFQTRVNERTISVTVPSYRRDVTIDVDIIEELARVSGYHTIIPTLPDAAPPVVMPDPLLRWEEEIKIRLRDWGHTEVYTYSMISEELMDAFGLDKTKAYKISNPLSREWVYMRPSLRPSMLAAIKQNSGMRPNLKLFELAMVYEYRPGDLPREKPMLLVAWAGEAFYEAKGVGEALCDLCGVCDLNRYGSIAIVRQPVTATVLELDVAKLAAEAKPQKPILPIPKYPPSFEDLAFILPPKTPVGPILTALKAAHPLVADVAILDRYAATTTFRITYQSLEKNLTAEDLRPVREKLIRTAEHQFGLSLKAI